MKRIINLMVLAAIGFFIAACSSDDYTDKSSSVKVTEAETTIIGTGGSATIEVTGSGITATSNADWLTVTVDGNTITATAEPNPSRESRSTYVTITASNGDKQIVSIVQNGVLLVLDSYTFEMGDYNATLDIDIKKNSEGVTVESQTSWLTAVLNPETNKIELVAENNDDTEPREGTVTVTMGDIQDVITIKQIGFLLNVGTDLVKATKDGTAESFKVDIEHSRDLTITTQGDWFTAEFNSATDQVEINVSQNSTNAPRVGYVTVTSGPVTKQIAVAQYTFDDLYGDDYRMYFATTATGNPTTYLSNVSLSEDQLGFTLYPNMPWTLPVTWDKENSTVSVSSGSYMGMYSTSYYVYLIFMSGSSTWSYFNVGEVMSAPIEVAIDANGNLIAQGTFSGTIWDGAYVADGWDFQALSAQEFDSANNLGSLKRIYKVTLRRTLATAPSN